VSAAIIQVDDDNVQCFGAQYHTINDAIAIANPGDEIEVCPGIYPEQVVLKNQLSIRGRRIGSLVPVIQPTDLPATRASIFGGNPIAAAVIVDTPSSSLTDLEIDLANNTLAGCTPVLAGVYWRNARGSQIRVDVKNARLAARPDCDSGIGTLIESGRVGDIFGQPVVGRSIVSIDRNRYVGFQKAGLVALGDRTLVKVQDSQAIGAGPSPSAVQNGFEIAKAARARLQDIAAQDLRTLIPGRTAAAVLVFSSDKVRVRRITATNVQTGVFIVGQRNRVLSGQFGDISSDAVVVLGQRNRIASNDIDGSSVSGVFIDGDGNRVLGGLIRSTPVGVWSFDGEGNTVRGVEFVDVTERIRTGDPNPPGSQRDLTAEDASPFDPACASGPACDDGNPCTTDSCTIVSGACVHLPLDDNSGCSDGNACNGAESCLAGLCVPGLPLVCVDVNECTIDTCVPATGCSFTANVGASCNLGAGACDASGNCL
jgi:hypothetical protein